MERESLTFKCLLMVKENHWSTTCKSHGPMTLSYMQCPTADLNAVCMFLMSLRGLQVTLGLFLVIYLVLDLPLDLCMILPELWDWDGICGDKLMFKILHICWKCVQNRIPSKRLHTRANEVTHQQVVDLSKGVWVFQWKYHCTFSVNLKLISNTKLKMVLLRQTIL